MEDIEKILNKIDIYYSEVQKDYTKYDKCGLLNSIKIDIKSELEHIRKKV